MSIQTEGNFVQIIAYVSLHVKKKENYFLKCELKWLYLYSRSSNREPESQASHVFVLILSSSSERLCESEFETALEWPMGTSLYHILQT